MNSIFPKIISILIIVFIFPILFFLCLLIYLDDGRPILFLQNRTGKNNKIFKIYKFRTMLKNMPDIPTHLTNRNARIFTKIGPFLRKNSLDELPQIFNILKGDMNFIGPRPALYNQLDLINLRTKNNIDKLTPGITGWAQVNGRDNLSIIEKVKMDEFYLKNKSTLLDIRILFLTILKVIRSEDISS